MLCCLLCLTVCAAPALAGNEQFTDGFLYWSNGAKVELYDGIDLVNLLDGYFPASISGDYGNPIDQYYRHFSIKGTPFDCDSTANVFWGFPAMYVEVLFSVPSPITVSPGGTPSVSQGYVSGYLALRGYDSGGGLVYDGQVPHASRIDCIYDNQHIETTAHNNNFAVPAGDYFVNRYFGYRFYFDRFSEQKAMQLPQWFLELGANYNGSYTFSDPNFAQGIYNEVTVNTGVLQEINGKLTEIQTSTTQIQSDVSDIKTGLQNSNSSIWQSFKDSVSGLFVPSSSDLESVKQGFDHLAQEKLGGAYQSVDLVTDGVSQVRDKMNNPTNDYSVEFPGIEVPLGEMYGTVRLIGRQDVTIPQKLRDVLYPIAGIIIPIVCTTWTVRLGIDMVNCFMSGMSYAEFLHRFTDEEDDEA